MKKTIALLLFFQSIFMWSQIALPIHKSLLPKNSLVVNYDFANTASYTSGTSVNNLSGTATGSATLFNSPAFTKTLGYISFDGINQYMATPNIRSYFKSVNASVQKSYTMSFWIYPMSLNGVIISELDSQTPSSGWHASNIEIVNGIVKYRIWNGTVISSTATINLNQWHHLAVVYDGTTLNAYLNGVLQGSQSNTREIPTTNQHYAIGAAETTYMGAGGYNKFHLAKFNIFNIPLNSTDISQAYNREKINYEYGIHTPNTNSNPTYWSVSSTWVGETFNQIHQTPWLNSSQGWSAGANDTNQFIILNYDEPITVNGIVTQGRANNGNQWVSSAHIDVSLNGTTWTRVMSNTTLNSNSTEDVRVLFPTPVMAKYVKVSPVTWVNHITMRLGILVKKNSFTSDNLVLHYNPGMTESYSGTGTTLTDLAGNGLTGTMSNITYNNPAFNFNGTTSQVSVSDNALLEPGTGSWTIETWIKPTQFTTSAQTVLGKFNNGGLSAGISYALRVYNGLIYSNFSNGTTALVSDGYSLTLNDWTQVIYVWDKTNNLLQTYINGQLNQTKAITLSSILNSTTNLYLGSYNGGEYPQYFKGQIGTVRLYNKALNSTEVSKNYNATKDFYEGLELKLDASNTISYPSSGVAWNDISGKGNHATLNNGPVFNASNGGQFVFDGVNDFASGVAIPSTSGNNSRTVMVWYKSTANKNTVLLDKGGVTDDVAEQLFLVASNSVGVGAGSYPPTNTGGIALCFWGNDLIYPVSSSTLFDGNWHFIAYTYNNTNRSVNICFDGTFASTVYQWNINAWTTLNTKPFSSPRVLNTTNNPYWIGQSRAAFWGFGGTFSNVNIPNVSIYSRALTESEILNVYNATRTRFY